MRALFALMLLFPFLSVAQPYGFAKDIDEFKGDTTLTSDFQKLNDPTWKGGHVANLRLAHSEGTTVLQLMLTTGGVLSVAKDAELLVKLLDGDVLTFHNTDFTIASRGQGSVGLRGSSSPGLQLFFRVSDRQLSALSASEIDKVRLTTSQGYIEIEPEKRKWAKGLREYFAMFGQIVG